MIIADIGVSKENDGGVPTGSKDEMDEISSYLKSKYGIRSMAVPVDVTNRESIKNMFQSVQKQFKTIEILCNNAGASFGVPSPIAGYNEEAWLRTIDVNLHGVFRVTQEAIPFMSSQNSSIINTASRAGKTPPLVNSAYAVAKAGVIMMTKVMAKEFAGMGIRVNAICPGQIMTDLEKWRFELEAKFLNSTAEARKEEMCKSIPLGRIGTVEEAANLAAFLASKESSYITGQAINITGGQLMEL